jgi:hypothetical protein
MTKEENDEVTYTVKITVTLTIPPQETQPTTVDANTETLPSNGDEMARAIDVVAETASLNDSEVDMVFCVFVLRNLVDIVLWRKLS